MHYVTLGNLGECTPNDASPGSCVIQAGWGLSNIGPFSNVQSGHYWSGLKLNASLAWRFYFNIGLQFNRDKSNTLFAWAVYDGDVGASVVPGARRRLVVRQRPVGTGRHGSPQSSLSI